jgi:pantoate--beta-alanine ligase
MQIHSQKIRAAGETIAFVPTMGFLHEGHLSLMRMARSLANHVVVSIFVNPTQFDPGEDFEVYPRDIEQDSKKVNAEGADTLFLPDTTELYPSAFETYIRLERLFKRLCGRFRPHHFVGVATIVAKLFNIVCPNLAIFGKKDYQQWLIIRRMVHDLNMNIEVIGAPIVRESDGLALSSRNSYLKKEERIKALSLFEALTAAEKKVATGVRNAVVIIQEAVDRISMHEGVAIDYVSVCDPETLDDVTEINKPVLMALAVKVGKTRLIDNLLLTPYLNTI